MTFSKLKFFSRLFNCSISSLMNTSTYRGISSKPLPFKSLYFGVLNTSFFRSCSSKAFLDSPFENVDLQAITKGDEELLKKLKVIILEAEVMRQEGMRVPSKISEERWLELLGSSSKSQRIKLLAFWWLNEQKKINQREKKENAKMKRIESLSDLEKKKSTDHIFYGIGGNSMFLRIYDSAIDYYNNYKLIQAMKFGPDLVIDCSYDEFMNEKEASLCATQLKILFSENRLKDEPFNVHFCNADRNSKVFRKLLKLIPTLYDDSFPVNISDKSFMDAFPKEKLVYLTPHCRDDLLKYDFDDVYIVGAIVDKTNCEPLSLAKAKSLGLRMAKFPLDRYLDWGFGSKSLTLNQVMAILHQLKSTGDWSEALKFVPKRKIKNDKFDTKFGSGSKKEYQKKKLFGSSWS